MNGAGLVLKKEGSKAVNYEICALGTILQNGERWQMPGGSGKKKEEKSGIPCLDLRPHQRPETSSKKELLRSFIPLETDFSTGTGEPGILSSYYEYKAQAFEGVLPSGVQSSRFHAASVRYVLRFSTHPPTPTQDVT